MKRVPVGPRAYALVDDRDYAKVRKYNWHARTGGYSLYAVTRGHIGKAPIRLAMHTLILGMPKKGRCIDHISGNGLDNRRNNLRVCSITENNRHRIHKNRNNKSGYRGVYLQRPGVWGATIKVNYKSIYLGGYFSPDIAALAYNRAAVRYFGEFAVLNEFQDK